MTLTEGQIRYRKYKETYQRYRENNKDKKHTRASNHKKNFGGMRPVILERDGYQCQECHMTMEEHKDKYNRELTIHHINGLGRYSEVFDNSLENLVTLCLSCHGKIDIKKKKRMK